MQIIIGLGNPGERFTNTRHNIGYLALDFFASENHLDEFTKARKFKALVSKNDELILVKPLTYMNTSGEAVSRVRKYYKGDIIVIHDELDLEFGKIKISKNRGSAGHKGILSINKQLGTKDYIRIRVGIGEDTKLPTEKFVLQKFDKDLSPILNNVNNILLHILQNGYESAMNEFNL